MAELEISKLKPGMKVLKPIITKRGQTIAKADTELTSQLIAKLSFYKIETVDIDVPIEEPKPEPIIEEPKPETVAPAKKPSEQLSYSQRLKASPKFQQFQTEYAIAINNLAENLDAVIAGAGADCAEILLENTIELFKSKTSLELLDMLRNMQQSVSDPIYAHSINVALIARAIGKWSKMSRDDLDTLTLCGLLHDIGKTQIPAEILNKPGKYTPEELDLVKSHPILGSKFIKGKDFDPRVLYATLQHHERSDGSGYPRNLTDDEIDDFASIIAISDVYDGMTSVRSYREPLCSFQVIACFEAEGFNKYNTQFLLTFLEHIANTYNNSRVMLNNAKTGRVVYINKHNLSRPVIELDSGDIMDLSHPDYKELSIQKII